MTTALQRAALRQACRHVAQFLRQLPYAELWLHLPADERAALVEAYRELREDMERRGRGDEQ